MECLQTSIANTFYALALLCPRWFVKQNISYCASCLGAGSTLTPVIVTSNHPKVQTGQRHEIDDVKPHQYSGQNKMKLHKASPFYIHR